MAKTIGPIGFLASDVMNAIPEQIGRLENRIEVRGRRSEVRNQKLRRLEGKRIRMNVEHRTLNHAWLNGKDEEIEVGR